MKGWVFDYGGTIDTNGCHWGQMIWHAYEREGVPVGQTQFREAYVSAERALEAAPLIRPGFTFRQTLQTKLRLQLEHLAVNGALSATMDGLETMRDRLLDDLYGQTVRQTARSKEVLRVLRGYGPMVLVSNFYGNLPTVLAEFGLDGLFLQVVESAAVGIRKPDPRLLRLGLQALDLPATEVVSVGDSFYKDIEPARRLGCQTVWLKGEGWTGKTYDETLPTAVVTDLEQLCNWTEKACKG